MSLKFALPKGWLQGCTSSFLDRADFEYSNYNESSRSYRPKSARYPDLFTKVFQEKDIAVQVATGNYDLAICGLDWIQELMIKYHGDAIVKLRDLGFGKRNIYVGASKSSALRSVDDVSSKLDTVRIVSEYPNLAEAFALKLRLRKFKVLPLWGSADAYPPEHADLAILSAAFSEELLEKNLVPIAKIVTGSAWLIANRDSLKKKDLSPLLSPLFRVSPMPTRHQEAAVPEIDLESNRESHLISDDAVILALPDGHQQSHAMKFLKNAGVNIKGYTQTKTSRRPALNFDGVEAKVVRPQDMPLQVANGNFDLAITGRDWLRDHLNQFPTSPAREVLDLGFGWVRIVAVVHNNMPVESVSDLRALLHSGRIPVLRIAAEYTNIADRYARDNHLSPYKVIPSWGATEAFLPEDADILIENTETGRTLAKNNLRIIETLFESTGCLIGNSVSLDDPSKKDIIDKLVETFRGGIGKQ